MALTALTTSMLLPRVKPGCRIASMGYPDMIAPLAMFRELLGEKFADIKYREDSPYICRYHGLEEHQIPDAESVFSVLGASLDVFDIVAHRGGEIVCDLNEPLDRREEYDFVLDVGTIEHCFNIGQAAKNMAGLLKAGGIIYHGNPHNAGNHGFYGLNPTWYADFYGQDGFRLLYCKLMAADSDEPMDIPLTGRFHCNHQNINIFAVARRDEVKPITFPMQSKYRKAK